MMRQDIHPKRHLIKVIMTDGTEFETHSTWGKEGEEMKLLIDPKTHPAYTGQRKILDQAGRMEKFNQRYRRKS